MMYCLIILLFSLFVLLYLVEKRRQLEPFVDSRLVQRFRIKMGVWYDKDYDNMHEYVKKIGKFIPIEIVKYSNRYQPFYELQRRNVDLIFSNEKDYFVFWNNERKGKKSWKDSFKRTPQIQAITMAYYQYLLIPADYDKILQSQDINDTVVSIPKADTLGHDFMVDLLGNFKTHTVFRERGLGEEFKNMCKKYDIMMIVDSHPNKTILENSNEKNMYLLDINIFQPSSEYYDKYLFLNKKKIDLTYYPVMLQRYNSKNRLGSLLIDGSPFMDGYGIKTMIMGLDTVNNQYVKEFTKAYYMNIFKVIKDYIAFNNFTILDMSASRLAVAADIVSFHEGARAFYRKIGNFTNNPNPNCAMLSNECTQDELDAAGDYAHYEY